MKGISRTKWLGTIILAGILVGIAMVGGNWGKSYAADVNATPYVKGVSPFAIKKGSPNWTVVISGNFDVTKNPLVTLLKENGTWETLQPPLLALPNGISQVVTADHFVEPIRYRIGVYQEMTNGTIPSNDVWFYVYEPLYSYLPVVKK